MDEHPGPPRRSNTPLVLAGIAIAALLAGGIAFLGGLAREERASAPVTAELYAGVPRSGASLGNADAPVVVDEYGDYQCPACRTFSMNTQPALIEEFVRPGKVRFVFHDYPTLGPESETAAVAAHCAGDQGKFWEFHDALYTGQGAENSGAFDREHLAAMARDIGLDLAAFETCSSKGVYLDAVHRSLSDATARGVSITPTFIIGGQMLEGAPEIEALRSLVAAALGGE